MQELSLNILDIAQNSVKAGATLIEITVEADTAADVLDVTIRDNGCGMSDEVLRRVTDPFYTTRTTRKVGLGLSFFQLAAQQTGGGMTVESRPGAGTVVKASFGLSHIDREPMGDLAGTVAGLVQCNPQLDFVYTLRVDGQEFCLDTREVRTMLDGVSLAEPEVALFLRQYLTEHSAPLYPPGF